LFVGAAGGAGIGCDEASSGVDTTTIAKNTAAVDLIIIVVQPTMVDRSMAGQRNVGCFALLSSDLCFSMCCRVFNLVYIGTFLWDLSWALYYSLGVRW
jgi:hypothetical protein